MVTTIVGLFIIVVITMDVLMTSFDLSGRSVISRPLYKTYWNAWRTLSAFVPAAFRQGILSAISPMIIIATVVLWLVLLVTAFACLYVDGPFDAALLLGEGTGTDWPASFRLSLVTISTIGFVEVGRAGEGYAVVVALQAVLGSIFITLSATYFLSVNQTITRRQTFINRFCRRGELVTRETIDQRVGLMASEMDALCEGLLRYPVSYHIRPAQVHASLPRLVEVADATLRASALAIPLSPDLPVARAGFERLLALLRRRFVPGAPRRSKGVAALVDHLYADLGYDDDKPSVATAVLRALSAPPKNGPRPLSVRSLPASGLGDNGRVGR